MELKEFQLNAVKSLFEAMDKPARDIILKSPTGSGKTIILTYFMHQYIQSFPKTVFVWLTPGKGNLEEQSKAKMDKYIHASQTKLLSDVMTAGFEENDSAFINWEKLTKKGNNALKDSERTNFLEHIQHALDSGLRFVVIVDESHQNNTVKADEIIQYFHTDKIIRCSATPKGIKNAEIIEIAEADVIAAGLIKKLLVINEDFPQTVETESQTGFLLERAYEKQRKLRAAFLSAGKEINPLIVVQIPNKSEVLQDEVERWFETQGVTFENGQLAVWLSDRHENLEGIEENNAKSVAVIIKQAVATGWDCPRAHILVKLRDNMDETFEIQTIGRIRRMPEAKHYNSDLLDSCYLYTLDEKFTAGVKMSLGKGALEAYTIFLKNEYKSITLTSEQRTMVTQTRNPQAALTAVAKYFEKEFHTGGNKAENATRLQTAGFVLDEDIVRHTISGETATLEFQAAGMNEIDVTEKLDTHRHGRDYHQKIGKIGLEIGMEYSYMNTIIRKLFDKKFSYSRKILALEPRAVYAFVLNNADRLRHIVREAMAVELSQLQLDVKQVSKTQFHIPQSCLFTFDSTAKTQTEMRKNVYQGYLSSAEVRSSSERKFEKFCENADSVEWVYKNGDKGSEYLSIVYMDNSEKQKNFFPDYIIGVNGEIWIVETKGGFDRSGNSQDIDLYTPKKFAVLKDYLDRYGLKGGIVRYDEKSEELCICMYSYSDDIRDDCWKVLSDIVK
ncbi:MAG: DEAD/DEAH box helicase family protein [Bacillota bacterium]|jgi:type III restriction enzyme